MTAAGEHELTGLEPDNLLAFLALLGLLRALETAQPSWHPRVVWRGSPPSAFLEVGRAATQDQIVTGADVGTKKIGRSYRVALNGKDNLKFTVDEFRQFAEKPLTDRSEFQVVCSLASDSALKKEGKEVEPTALCVMFGSGRQCFLGSFSPFHAREPRTIYGRHCSNPGNTWTTRRASDGTRSRIGVTRFNMGTQAIA